MPSGNRPSVRLRRIGSALRKARDATGMTVGTAARRYGRSKSWLSTLENGLHSVEPQELADLLDFYGVTDATLRESLLHLATHSPFTILTPTTQSRSFGYCRPNGMSPSWPSTR
jgi:transcriptional regulator with XRE-family HTH domain